LSFFYSQHYKYRLTAKFGHAYVVCQDIHVKFLFEIFSQFQIYYLNKGSICTKCAFPISYRSQSIDSTSRRRLMRWAWSQRARSTGHATEDTRGTTPAGPARLRHHHHILSRREVSSSTVHSSHALLLLSGLRPPASAAI
jgi:hypothetical protein